MKRLIPKTIFGLAFLFSAIVFCALAVTVVAAAIKAPSPTFTGGTKLVLQPTNTLLPMVVRYFLNPS